MKRSDAIAGLKRQAEAVKSLGATALYLFGSTARDQAEQGSDLDIVIDHDSGGHFSLLDLVGIKQLLEEQLKTEIDVTTRNSLNPMLRGAIEQSAVRIF